MRNPNTMQVYAIHLLPIKGIHIIVATYISTPLVMACPTATTNFTSVNAPRHVPTITEATIAIDRISRLFTLAFAHFSRNPKFKDFLTCAQTHYKLVAYLQEKLASKRCFV